MDVLSSVSDLISFILKSVASFVEFVLCLPNFIYDLVSFIPEPLKSITGQFIVFIILIVVIMATAKIVSSVKGG